MILHVEYRFLCKMEEIYVLQLQNGKYYVGKTSDFERRYQEHKTGYGSVWTSMHKPIKVVELRTLKDEHDENNTTKQYMKKYGIDNVRGGSYTQTNLPDSFKTTLEAEIRGSTNACFKCGLQGHFAKECNVTIRNKTKPTTNMGLREFAEHLSKKYLSICDECDCDPCSCQKSYGRDTCYRCGRTGHWAEDCYATYHAKGYEIES